MPKVFNPLTAASVYYSSYYILGYHLRKNECQIFDTRPDKFDSRLIIEKQPNSIWRQGSAVIRFSVLIVIDTWESIGVRLNLCTTWEDEDIPT